MYSNLRSLFKTCKDLADSFQKSGGVLQGWLLSPKVFNLFLKTVISFVETNCCAHMRGVLKDKLAYPDDID